MRAFIFGLAALSFLSSPAMAHPEPEPAPIKKIEKIDIKDLKLPTEAEIEDMIDQMPDFNAIMGGLMKVMQDEDIRDSMKDAGKSFAQSVEKSGIKDMTADLDKGEMPDFNTLLATMMRMASDESVMGNMLDVVEELQESVEVNLDEEMFTPKSEKRAD